MVSVDMRRWRQITAFVLLGMYGATGILLEGLHRDAIALLLTADPVLVTHSCGEREMHVPLDQAHVCAVCARWSDRLSLPAPDRVLICPLRVLAGVLSADFKGTPSTFPVNADTRGPPAA